MKYLILAVLLTVAGCASSPTNPFVGHPIYGDGGTDNQTINRIRGKLTGKTIQNVLIDGNMVIFQFDDNSTLRFWPGVNRQKNETEVEIGQSTKVDMVIEFDR